MNVNQAAFCTVTLLAGATIATAVAAATTAATVATVAYSILAVGLGGLSIASITAWLDPDSTDVNRYFEKMQSHAGVAMAGAYTFFAQVMVQAVIQGIANGVSKMLTRKIAGPDHTYQAY